MNIVLCSSDEIDVMEKKAVEIINRLTKKVLPVTVCKELPYDVNN